MSAPFPTRWLHVLTTLIAAGFFFGCTPSSNEPEASTRNVASHATTSKWQTEQTWIIGQVCEFIAALGDYHSKSAATSEKRDSGPDETIADGVSVAEEDMRRIPMDAGVWDPVSYQSFARRFFSDPDPAVLVMADQEFAKVLLAPNFTSFHAQNKRLSQFLSKHPASASGHVQAALLLGTIALNDHSGVFRDVRIPLNRMIAHLSVADALGVSSEDRGRRLAELIRLTLCGRQTYALLMLRDFADDSPVWAEWNLILRLRNTGDWRDGRERALSGSDGLKLEYFRALTHSVGAESGLAFLEEAKVSPGLAHIRIANETSLSVEQGHIFAKSGLGMELQEASTAAKAFGVDVSSNDLGWFETYANTPEGSPVAATAGSGIDIAGRNLLAGYHQRHLMQAAHRMFEFLHDRWGVKDEAGRLGYFLSETLPETRYTPFLKRLIARDDATRRAANQVCEEVIRTLPEMVTPALWMSLRDDHRGRRILPYPDHHVWFNPEVLPGTAFEVGERLYRIGLGDESDDAWMREVWSRAPYVYSLARYNAYHENGDSHDNMDAAIAKKWLGQMTEFHLRAMRYLANSHKHDPESYRATMLQAARLAPNLYIDLAQTLEEMGRRGEAAEAYLEAFEKATDRVRMANSALPLVEYLYEKGDLRMAETVAQHAAEVYSYRGLETHGWLQEQRGNWSGARETARKIDARYNKTPLAEAAHLMRMSIAQPGVAKQMEQNRVVIRIFPSGIQRVAMADFSAAPRKGVLINGDNRRLAELGLRAGMVIVALNGIRTDNFEQYDVVRALSSDPEMNLIVWDGAYKTSEGQIPGRRFNVDMVDYTR